MTLNFGHIFQKKSKDRTMRGLVHIPKDHSRWPKDWTVVTFKEYKRFQKIKLPEPDIVTDLFSALKNRRSSRKWDKKPLTIQNIANILYGSCGITLKTPDINNSKRAQASAGARFPVEVYIVNYQKGELGRTVYHYNVQEHALDALWDLDSFSGETLGKLFNNVEDLGTSAAIVLTGVTSRFNTKYGERGYRYAYLEAGEIAHAMNIIACADGLGCLIYGASNDEAIEGVLDIDGEDETLLCTLLFGVPPAE